MDQATDNQWSTVTALARRAGYDNAGEAAAAHGITDKHGRQPTKFDVTKAQASGLIDDLRAAIARKQRDAEKAASDASGSDEIAVLRYRVDKLEKRLAEIEAKLPTV